MFGLLVFLLGEAAAGCDDAAETLQPQTKSSKFSGHEFELRWRLLQVDNRKPRLAG